MKYNQTKTVIFTDVAKRHGIGIELYQQSELLLEIFRDDLASKTTITLFKDDILLDLVEQAIDAFKKEIPPKHLF